MDDMVKERTLGEIIGWTIEDNPWYRPETAYREERQRIKANGEYWNTSKRPTVDDLLAWLKDNDFSWYAEQLDELLYFGIASGAVDYVYRAPTLLAALEAAVRAVAS